MGFSSAFKGLNLYGLIRVDSLVAPWLNLLFAGLSFCRSIFNNRSVRMSFVVAGGTGIGLAASS